jgi:hypothetical protein
MKASSEEVTTRSILLELSEREATILCALVGGVSWNLDNEAGEFLQETFSQLDGLLPERSESFCDFFTGDVWCRGDEDE